MLGKNWQGFATLSKGEGDFFLNVAGASEHSNAKILGGMGLCQLESKMATILRQI